MREAEGVARELTRMDREDCFGKPLKPVPQEKQRYFETVSFGAREATIFSNRGSPRKGSHIGFKRRSP
jgi:hypothetical protein